MVVDTDEDAKRVVLKGLKDSRMVTRHLDDAKGYRAEQRNVMFLMEPEPRESLSGELKENQNVEAEIEWSSPV